MSQRRSYSHSNSGDFNLDDLFRPEPDGQQPPAQQGVPAEQQYQGGPEYLGGQGVPQQQTPAEPAPATQFLPPYPSGDPMAGQQPPAQQGYGAPQPMDGQQAYGGQTFGGQQAYGGQTFGGQQPSYGGQQQFQPAPPGYAPAPESRRPGNRLIIGGVAAGCVAAAVLVAVLLSGGDKEEQGGTTPTAKTSATASTPAGTGSAVSPETKAQAQALSDLIGEAGKGRQTVVNAVTWVGNCEKLPEAQQALNDAAVQRDQLVTRLAALKTDQLTSGAQLSEQLKLAWEASAKADREYALWATDALAGCDKATTKDNAHNKLANAASGQATTAKKQASALWNAIATQTGLPTKTNTDL